nr:MAG TPA: hypothetical protein [Caudoviricetes sp.]
MEGKKSLTEALKTFEKISLEDIPAQETQEERNVRLAKLTPKERAKVIVDEIFEFSGEGFLTEEEEKECTYE